MTGQTLRVVVATAFDVDLAALMREREPRLELVVEPELLPPMRHAADFAGDPSFTRTPAQQRRFERLLLSADALYGIPDVDPRLLARTVHDSDRLRWVHTMAAGGGSQVRDAGLTREELSAVLFTTSAGVHGDSLAEFAVFGVLAGAKHHPRLRRQQDAHEWSGRWPMRQVSDLSVLVYGVGGIGRRVAHKLRALGAHIVGVSRRGSGPVEFDEVILPESVAGVLGRVDAIVSTLPGTHATEGLIGADVFEALGPRTTIVNVGRGSVIDERALIAFLTANPDAFAALDVFEIEPLDPRSPLWDLKNVIVSPHTAALTDGEERRIAELFAENARRLLDGEPLLNRVDTVEFY